LSSTVAVSDRVGAISDQYFPTWHPARSSALAGRSAASSASCRTSPRHPRFVGRRDVADQFALVDLARHDCSATAEVGESGFFGVEVQIRLALVLVGTVTGVALVRENWANVAVERDRCGGVRVRGDKGEYEARKEEERMVTSGWVGFRCRF